MGGNVQVMGKDGKDHAANKLNLKKVRRVDIRLAFIDLFVELNRRFKDYSGKPLWENELLLRNGHVFNGSSEALFDGRLDDDEFIDVKHLIGDIDVTVPHQHKIQLWELLKLLQGKKITKLITYIGNNVESPLGAKAQINALFKYSDGKHTTNMQVDFEFLPYDDKGAPTKFAKFSHSSNWDDLKIGLKGVHHKYLLRALAGGSSQRKDVQVITKARGQPQKNPNGVQFNKFSVDRGLRIGAYKPVMDGDVHRVVNGLPAYHEIPPAESTYTTDVGLIAHHILDTDALKQSEIDNQMHSFVGVLSLMKKYLSKEKITATLDRLAELYWGPGAQGFERNNPELDKEIKMVGWNIALKTFPFYKSHNINTVIESYYDNYRMTEISL